MPRRATCFDTLNYETEIHIANRARKRLFVHAKPPAMNTIERKCKSEHRPRFLKHCLFTGWTLNCILRSAYIGRRTWRYPRSTPSTRLVWSTPLYCFCMQFYFRLDYIPLYALQFPGSWRCGGPVDAASRSDSRVRRAHKVMPWHAADDRWVMFPSSVSHKVV